MADNCCSFLLPDSLGLSLYLLVCDNRHEPGGFGSVQCLYDLYGEESAVQEEESDPNLFLGPSNQSGHDLLGLNQLVDWLGP